MQLFRLLLVALFAVPGVGGASDARALLPHVGDLASLLSDGTTHLAPSSVRTYSSDKRAAVVFTLEGSTSARASSQFVAFVARNEWLSGSNPAKPYRLLAFLPIGRRGDRMFDPASGSFERDRLVLVGTQHASGDSTCCPSQRVRSAFVLRDDRLVEHVLTPPKSNEPGTL